MPQDYYMKDEESGYIHITRKGVEWVYYIDLSTDEHIVHRWSDNEEVMPQDDSVYRCVWLYDRYKIPTDKAQENLKTLVEEMKNG